MHSNKSQGAVAEMSWSRWCLIQIWSRLTINREFMVGKVCLANKLWPTHFCCIFSGVANTPLMSCGFYYYTVETVYVTQRTVHCKPTDMFLQDFHSLYLQTRSCYFLIINEWTVKFVTFSKRLTLKNDVATYQTFLWRSCVIRCKNMSRGSAEPGGNRLIQQKHFSKYDTVNAEEGRAHLHRYQTLWGEERDREGAKECSSLLHYLSKKTGTSTSRCLCFTCACFYMECNCYCSWEKLSE